MSEFLAKLRKGEAHLYTTATGKTASIATDAAMVLYGPLLRNVFSVWETMRTNDAIEGAIQWKELAIKLWKKEDIDKSEAEKLAKKTAVGTAKFLACLRSQAFQCVNLGFSVRDHIESALQLALSYLSKHVEIPEWARMFVTAISLYLSSVLYSRLVVFTAVLSSAQNLTRTLNVPHPQLASYVVTAFGIWHIFVYGGHTKLPGPIRALLWLPLQIDGFLGFLSGATEGVSGVVPQLSVKQPDEGMSFAQGLGMLKTLGALQA
eukprot:TRINITY_DN4307_c3_g1_i1.p1 TRINITY_DN4307_c3_g1~~TRINITY_DN4307_c3_g1_i1.p1  ORF type:complete len:278 (+),score=57.92 TRINITY_DN4307_c3_g1_i1:47-835(+)